ncbi:MAG: hypothetical protein AB8B73_16245 [Ekhidna sp.]
MLSGCLPQTQTNGYQLVYKNDKEGRTIVGSKESLINAIRLGANIKIGWGSKGKEHTIEHLSEPVWIAILDESEVIAHLDPQVFSTINWDDLTATYTDSLGVINEWRVAITTNGDFDAIWYDRKHHQISKRVPQNHIMSWYIKDVSNNQSAVPLFSTE